MKKCTSFTINLLKVGIIINNVSPANVNMIVFSELTKLHECPFLFNPFLKAPPMPLSFATYTTVTNVPNGKNEFKIVLTNPVNEVIHESDVNSIDALDNAFSNMLIWNNIPFSMLGEHTITLYLANDKGKYEPCGGTVLIIAEPPPPPPIR